MVAYDSLAAARTVVLTSILGLGSSETPSLRVQLVEQLVRAGPPHLGMYSILRSPTELRVMSKALGHDTSLQVDNPEFSEADQLLDCLVGRRAIDALLFYLDMQFRVRVLLQAGAALGLGALGPPMPHPLRHGGSSPECPTNAWTFGYIKKRTLCRILSSWAHLTDSKVHLEVFSASGNWSQALRRSMTSRLAPRVFELDMDHEPTLGDLSRRRAQRAVSGWLRGGLLQGVWLGMPCSSWSRARNRPNGPPPLRGAAHVLGLPDLSSADSLKVETGNKLSQFSFGLFLECARRGVPAAIENPSTSWIWQTRWAQHAARQPGVKTVEFDFCAFGTAWRMQMKGEIKLKECKATVEKAKKACQTISVAKSALISTAMRELVQKRGITVDALFDELAASGDKISEEAFSRHVAAADGTALQPEHVALVARSIEAGGISRRRFLGFVQRYYTVVKPIAITDVLDVTKAKTKRKAEVNEIIEVLEGPCIDEKLKMSRIRGKSLVDSVEGWISIQGNQGTPFLTEAAEAVLLLHRGAALEKEFQTSEPAVRTLGADEIVELLEGPRKETFAPALRARGKACKDQAQGWFTARNKKGTILAEADANYYSCVTSVAMTDELDVKNCNVVRKLAVGELFTVTEGPVEEKDAGITRVKGKAVKDDKEGWITSKGNAGTVYAEPSKKHWSIVQEQPLTKLFKSTGAVEEVRKLEAGEAVLLLEGPKEETFPPETRIRARALSDGATGWVTLKGAAVKKWSPFYKVVVAGPAHDTKAIEGAQVLRETSVGESLEWLEGPVQEGQELRMKARLQKDGVVGWVSIKDAEGKRLVDNAA
ncbi:unnamed protein product [Prorocentrum cordatum]|uniref:Uncharacterized protein n=1 Tax=Prorocentrum cordatum TaxID=2364126 RepID=A0ABN9SAM1_9DINO|nr:unnamed protein product [Polarella glacialis]